MKNKKLENLFLDYMNDLVKEDIDWHVKDEDQMWLVFSEEDFHINRKKNTLYVKPIDVLIDNLFNDENVVDGHIDWIAYQSNLLTLEHKITAGLGNPFLNATLTSFVNGRPIVKAIPYQYGRKMNKKDKNK